LALPDVLVEAFGGLPGADALRRDAGLRAGAGRAGFFFGPVRREVDLAMRSQFELRPARNDHGGGGGRKRGDGRAGTGLSA
jgi:hypothetical protein